MEKKHTNLHQYGLTEAIFLALYKEDYESSSEENELVNNRQEIVEALLLFAKEKGVPLNKDGDFGLKAACDIACIAGYATVVQALQDLIAEDF